MAVVIRAARPRDREHLIDLIQALNRHEDAIVGDRRTDPAAAEENLDSVAARVAETQGCFFVAELEGRVVGLLALVFPAGDIYVRAKERRHAEISTVVVADESRRHGVGRALMAAAEEAAQARGCRRLALSVLAGNEAAMAAYARQGFRPRSHELEKRLG